MDSADALQVRGRPMSAQLTHVAAFFGSVHVLRQLLGARADPAAQGNWVSRGNSTWVQPIHLAAEQGHTSVVQQLPRAPSDANIIVYRVRGQAGTHKDVRVRRGRRDRGRLRRHGRSARQLDLEAALRR